MAVPMLALVGLGLLGLLGVVMGVIAILGRETGGGSSSLYVLIGLAFIGLAAANFYLLYLGVRQYFGIGQQQPWLPVRRDQRSGPPPAERKAG